MKTMVKILAGALAPALIWMSPAIAEPLWGVTVDRLEYRVGENNGDVAFYDVRAYVGTDELKVVWRGEGEFSMQDEAWEALENQLRLQVPISRFFDAVAGVRVDTPEGPNRTHAVVGVKGLAPQWFQVDADFYLSNHPSFRFEGEFEGLITNRITLTPRIGIDLPFTDDPALGQGAWGPKVEAGLRLSYDLVDRAFSPYIGVHYERVLGETASIARANGSDAGALFFVAGARIMY